MGWRQYPHGSGHPGFQNRGGFGWGGMNPLHDALLGARAASQTNNWNPAGHGANSGVSALVARLLGGPQPQPQLGSPTHGWPGQPTPDVVGSRGVLGPQPQPQPGIIGGSTVWSGSPLNQPWLRSPTVDIGAGAQGPTPIYRGPYMIGGG